MGVLGRSGGREHGAERRHFAFLSLRAEVWKVLPAPTNDWVVRRDAVGELFERMVDGRPAFMVDPGHCTILTAALDGQYAYPRMHTGDERYGDRPLKNRFSHVADALQYVVLGGGEGRVLFQRTAIGRAVAPARVVHAQTWRGRGWGRGDDGSGGVVLAE